MNSKAIRDDYHFIHFLESEGLGKKHNDLLISMKREIREWNKRPVRHIFDCDDYGGYIELIDAPDWCETEQDVIDWFEGCVYIHAYFTYYDCTGRPFTAWYKPVFRQGSWKVYHRIELDVRKEANMFYKITLWNHDKSDDIEINFYGYASLGDAWHDYYDKKEEFEKMLTGDDYADGTVYPMSPEDADRLGYGKFRQGKEVTR